MSETNGPRIVVPPGMDPAPFRKMAPGLVAGQSAAGGGNDGMDLPGYEAAIRADEIQRALNSACSECAEGREPERRGRLKHRSVIDTTTGPRVYWTVCGADDWTGRYLKERLMSLRAGHAAGAPPRRTDD